MKVIIRKLLPWGNYHSTHIYIESHDSIEHLKQKIYEIFNIQPHQQILKIDKDGFKIRIVAGFSIEFYEIKENSQIFLENIQSQEETNFNKSNLISLKYRQKLGLIKNYSQQSLESIEEDFSQDKFSTLYQWQNHNIKTSVSNQNLASLEKFSYLMSESFEIKEEQQVKQRQQQKFFILQKQLQQETKNGNLQRILQIFEEIKNENLKESDYLSQKENILSNLINDINAQGSGWNLFHYSIFYEQIPIFKMYLRNRADVNKKTLDELNPLQISIKKNNQEIFYELVNHEKIDINNKTNKGTALHFACQKGSEVFIEALLDCNINTKIRDSDGKSAFELIKSPQKRSFFCNELQIRENLNSQILKDIKKQIYKYKGWIYKLGTSMFITNRRYFEIDPQQGTFIRYKNLQDYPLKPIEVVPLKDINYITKLEKNSWYRRNNLTYFEVNYGSKQTLACKFDQTANLWMKHLYESSVFANFVEKQNKSIQTIIEFAQNQQALKTIEIQDQDNNEQVNISPLVLKIQKVPRDAINQPFSPTYQFSPKLSKKQSKFSIENQNKSKDHQTSLQDDTKVQNSNDKISDKIMTETAHNSEQNENFTLETNQTQYEQSQLSREGKKVSVHQVQSQENQFLRNYPVKFKDFKILNKIGSGTFGNVFLVKSKNNEEVYAMKCLNKARIIKRKLLAYAITESNILQQTIANPFVIQLQYAFQTPDHLYLVLDYCAKGDLSLHLAQEDKFSEKVAKFYIAELILAIESIHKLDVIYRDLKPENILIGNDGHIRLADFGLCKEGMRNGDVTKSFCGSPAYLAPEMIQKQGHGKAADFYGIGCILYEMLTGDTPYYDEKIPKMYEKIMQRKLKFPLFINKHVKDLIQRLLEPDPKLRIGAMDIQELKNHTFFKNIDWNLLSQKKINPPINFELDEIGHETNKRIFIDQDYEDDQEKVHFVQDYNFINPNNIES